MKKPGLTKPQVNKLQKNEKNFLAAEQAGQDDSSLFKDLHDFFIRQLMIAKNLTSRKAAQNLIMQQASSTSPNDFALQLPHSIIERFSGGRFQDAADLFTSYQNWIKAQHAQKSKRAASFPRPSRSGAIGALIDNIVRADPHISTAGLLQELKQHQRGYVIDLVDDTHIYGSDGQEIPISALRGRLSRTKKKLNIE